MNRKHWTVLFALGLFILACKKDNPVKEEIETWLGFVKPANFPDPEYK
ncbi:MAG: cytochrome-c peroxidase, partial [Pedobacter sp.]